MSTPWRGGVCRLSTLPLLGDPSASVSTLLDKDPLLQFPDGVSAGSVVTGTVIEVDARGAMLDLGSGVDTGRKWDLSVTLSQPPLGKAGMGSS